MPGYELIGDEEFNEVKDVFTKGGVLFRHGFDNLRHGCYKVKEFEGAFASTMGMKYSLAVTSGTAALRVSLAALGIGEGDEVISPSFTFVATIEAIIESKATPVCAEIDLTLNLDPEDLVRRITSRTKAVIVVHMLGTPARLTEIADICTKYNLFLIEDTAWGCGGMLNNRFLGTWGDVGTFSFDYAKTITTGEGGMILFKEKAVFERATAWHDHGHENNPTVPRWEDTRSSSGFNYRMMELQGAIGLAQLRKLSYVIKMQQNNKTSLWNAISGIDGLYPRMVPPDSYETSDALVFFVENNKVAKECRESLLKIGLSTKILPEAYSWHFAGTWNHMPQLVTSHGGDLSIEFKKSREILSRAVSLPISISMKEGINEKVKNCLLEVLNK